ncbi:aromatic acid exporter family protein [Streptomyces sp. RB6PN25]|uniref:Aromatic acid exporter family protein n=1 Tax=Streptomyces humicola TaxID=2953240 RepID=A0ABT1PNR9_9ACTN|nr:aromatic acid exporter family protein [Streptomyces humicola]MCQ4079320.1 aromatic acid exporter family protein [Streptomyces humicola]
MPVLDLVRRRRDPVVQSLRSTAAAVLAYLVALRLAPDRLPLLAPLTAVLVVQVSLYATLTTSIKRITTVVTGLLVAVVFSDLVGLSWWSMGALILASLTVGHLLRLGELVPEVAVSAMLVLGVSNPAVNALNRLTEALIGAAAGVVVNVLIPPPVYVQPAGEAVQDLAGRMSRLLRDVALQLQSGATRERAEVWLRAARRLDREIIHVERELDRAEESLRFNPRARPLRHSGMVLRGGLDTLERCSVSLRSLCRSLSDLGRDRERGERIYSADLAAPLARLLTHLADAVHAFGLLTKAHAVAEADSINVGLGRSLADARELRERLARLLRAKEPGSWETHGTLLANAARMIEELETARWSRTTGDEANGDGQAPPAADSVLQRLPWLGWGGGEIRDRLQLRRPRPRAPCSGWGTRSAADAAGTGSERSEHRPRAHRCRIRPDRSAVASDKDEPVER